MAFQVDPSYLYNAMMAESSGNPNAQANTSSAGGLYGFTDPTFLQHARQFFPAGTSDAEILAKKRDSELQTKAMNGLTQANAGVLSQANIPTTNPNLYAAHFLGAGDAKDVLTAPDGDPASDYIEDKSVAANPFLKGMTVGQFKQWSAKKIGQLGSGPDPDVPAAGAQATQGQLPPGTPDPFSPAAQQGQGGDLGGTLQQLGAIMMSRGNPVGAQTLQTMINAQRGQAKADTYSTDTKSPITGKDGQQYYVRTNDRTGGVDYVPIPAGKQEVEDPDANKSKPTPGILKNYQTNQTSMRNYSDLVDDINKFEKLVTDNDLQMNVLDTGIAEFKNRMGQADPDSAAIKEAQRLQNRIKFEYLKQEPGATTKQKIQQAGDIMFPAGSQFSTQTYLKSIQDAKQTIINGYLGIKDANEGVMGQFKGIPQTMTGPDGKSVNPADWHQGNIERWNKFDDTFRPQMQSYIDQKNGRTTQQGPVTVQSPDDARKLAPGTHFVTPDGREFTR